MKTSQFQVVSPFLIHLFLMNLGKGTFGEDVRFGFINGRICFEIEVFF